MGFGKCSQNDNPESNQHKIKCTVVVGLYLSLEKWLHRCAVFFGTAESDDTCQDKLHIANKKIGLTVSCLYIYIIQYTVCMCIFLCLTCTYMY